MIGFDFSFFGKSQNEEADRWFADAISKNGRVVLASYFDIEGGYGYILPSEMFLKGARAAGFVNIPSDQDGIARRTRILLKLADHRGFAYSFASQLACAYWNLRPEDAVKMRGQDVVFQLPSKKNPTALQESVVPLDRRFHIPFSLRYVMRSIHYIPFWKVIAGEVDKKDIEGKILIVGGISPVIHDIHGTATGLMPGVFINAYQTLMILEHDFLVKVWPYQHWIFLLALTVIFYAIFFRLSFVLGLILVVVAEWAVYDFSIWLFTTHRLIFSVFSSMFVLALVFLLVLLFKGLLTFIENASLQRRVMMDGLTGLFNQNYIPPRLGTELERYRRLDKEFCFVMIDIDWFKKVNDTYGHERGNEVLVGVAKCLRKGTRMSDVVARYGGEEFCMILFDCDAEAARQVTEKIRRLVESTVFSVIQKSIRITISAGICSNKASGIQRSTDLIHLADEMLYEAKTAGRNRICVRAPSD